MFRGAKEKETENAEYTDVQRDLNAVAILSLNLIKTRVDDR